MTGYQVEGGRIEITGAGLNASETNYTDIISQSAAINAGVWANDLKVTTGRNKVSVDHSHVTPLESDGETQGVALDVSALGGMYAGHIRLIGTDRGLGVRNAGSIVAQVGEVVLTNSGRLENSGTISGQKSVKVDTKGNIDNRGRIQSPGAIKIDSKGSFSNRGEVVTNAALEVSAEADLSNSGTVQSLQDLSLSARKGSISNSGSGKILTGGKAKVRAAEDVRNAGEIQSAGLMEIEAHSGLFENNGLALANSAMTITAGTALSNLGELKTGGDLILTARGGALKNQGLMVSNERIALLAAEDVITSGEVQGLKGLSIEAAGGKFVNDGSILTDGSALITAAGDLSGSGTLKSAGELTLVARGGSLSNSGVMVSGGAADLKARFNIINTGAIQSIGGLTMVAETGSIDSNKLILTEAVAQIKAFLNLINGGEILSGGDLTLLAETGSINSSNLILTEGAADIKARVEVINSGEIQSGGDLTILAETGSINNAKLVLAGGSTDIQAYADLISGGQIQSGGDLRLWAETGLIEFGNQVLTQGAADIRAHTDLVNKGGIQARGDLSLLAATGSINSSGLILTEGRAEITAYQNLANSGGLQAQGDLDLWAQTGSINSSNLILAEGQADIQAYVDVINSGEIQAKGDLIMLAETGSINSSNLILTEGKADIKARLNLANSGKILSKGDLKILAETGSLNNSKLIVAEGSADIRAYLDLINDGDIQSGGDLSILSVTGSFNNNGTLYAGGRTEYSFKNGFVNSGELQSGGDLVLNIESGSFENQGLIVAGGQSLITALEEVINSGQLHAVDGVQLTSLQAFFKNSESGEILTNGAAVITAAGSWTNLGEIRSGGNFSATGRDGSFVNSGQIVANGLVSILAGLDALTSGLIQSAGGQTIKALTGRFENLGDLLSGGETLISAKTGWTNTGELESVGDLTIVAAQEAFANEGGIISGGRLSVTAGGAAVNEGSLQSVGDLALTAGGAFSNVNDILSNGTLVIKAAGQVDNSGLTQSLAGLALTAESGGLSNSGKLLTNGLLSISAYLGVDNSLAIEGGGGLTITAKTGAFENSGAIFSGAQSKVESETGFTNTSAAEFSSLGDLEVISAGFFQNDGSLAANGRLSAAAAGDWVNTSKIQSLGGLNFRAEAGSWANSGQIITSGGAEVRARNSLSNTSEFHSLEGLSLTSQAGAFDNQGQMLSGGLLKVEVLGDISNSGLLQGEDGLQLISSGGKLDNRASLMSMADLLLSVSGDILNTADSDIQSVGEADIRSKNGGLVNQGLLFAGNGGSLNLGGGLSNSGRFLSNGDLAATISAGLSNTNEFSIAGTLRLKAGGDIVNEGELLANNAYIVTSSTFRNEKLVDGGEVIIRAAAIENHKYGTLLADHLGLEATNIFNGQTGEGVGTSGLIGAREQLDIGVSGLLTNREDGVIYSGGDFIIGRTLDDEGLATGRGGTLRNSSALIDVAGSLIADLAKFENVNDHFSTRKVVETNYHSAAYQFHNVPDYKWYIHGSEGVVMDDKTPILPYHSYAEYHMMSGITETLTRYEVASSRPGFIYAGQNIHITGDLINNKSKVSAGQTLRVDGSSNLDAYDPDLHTVTTISWVGTHMTRRHTSGSKWTQDHITGGVTKVLPSVDNVLDPLAEVVPERKSAGDSSLKDNGSVSASKQFNGSDTVAGSGGHNLDLKKPTGPELAEVKVSGSSGSGLGQDISAGSGSAVGGLSDGTGRQLEVSPPDVSLPVIILPAMNSNMYTVNPSSTSNYVVETNPRLTNHRQWLSSDFMLARMNTDPNVVHKRLGDGFYEQRLVREQIGKLTGFMYLADYASEEEQYLALMNAGLEFAEEYQFSLGVSLSAEQMARLTSDIVWMEYVTVETEYGPVTALAPKVYLAPGREILMTAGGGMVSARDIVMDLSGDFHNGGQLLAANSIDISAQNLDNIGHIAGGLVSLASMRDLNNIGGSIVGLDAVLLSAGGDINLTTTTLSASSSFQGGFSKVTSIGRVASVTVKNSDGLLAMEAGGDINFKAAVIDSAGDALIWAEGDVNVAGVNVSNENRVSHKSGSYVHLSESTDVGSLLAAGGDLEISAGRDFNVVGSQVLAGGDLVAQAGGDISITEGRSETVFDSLSKTKKSGFLSTSKTTSKAHIEEDLAIGSEVSGNTVTMVSGGDFTLRGSDVVASEGLAIAAEGNVDISGAENSYSHYQYTKTTKSGFTGGLSGGQISVGYGKSEQGKESQTDNNWHSASMVGSENGLVSIYSGLDTNISGSHVVAGTGDVAISGQNVTIDSQIDTYDYREKQWSKQSGFSIGLGLSGGSAGGALSSGMDAYNNITSATNAKSDRAAALYGMAAARDVYDTVQGLPGAKESLTGLAQGNVSGSGLSISIGFNQSSSQSKFESHDEVAVGSSITSGGDTFIVARGDENGRGGDLNIIGSTVEAGGWVTLAANNDLNLVSAEELSSFKSSNKSSSSGISVGYQIGGGLAGLSGSVYANKGQGSGSGESVSHAETVIKGGEGVQFASVGDTLIKGAQIIGDKVIGDVGGNLSIISEQDTDRQRYKQSSTGGGISLGSGGPGANFNSQKQNAKGDYAGVNEQSGIFAGDGGFDITVGGHTSLVGAVIDSTAEASKNNLTTGSLSTEDLSNHSDYSASTSGFGVEIGQESKLSPSLPMKEKGGDDSTTRSAIAAGTVTITDEAAQLARTGQTAQDMLASLNRDTAGAHQGALDKNPDLQDILGKQAEIVDAAGKAGKAVAETAGDIAKYFSRDYDKAQLDFLDAETTLRNPNATNEEKVAAQLQKDQALSILNDPEVRAEWEKWQEGGIYKAALQTAGAALVAQIGNGEGLNAAMGAAASQLAAGKVKEFAHTIAQEMTDDKGAQGQIANMISNAISSGIGFAVGGETGSDAASTMDRYNRQLHPKEVEWIEQNADRFAALMCDQGQCISEKEAKQLLAQQALRQLDAWWQVSLALTPEQLQNTEYVEKVAAASAFLATATGSMVVTHPGRSDTTQGLFTLEGGQFGDHRVFADQYIGWSGGQNFYGEYVRPGKTISGNDTLRDVVNAYYIDGAKSTVDAILNDPDGFHQSIWFSMFDYGHALYDEPGETLQNTANSVKDLAFGIGESAAYQLDPKLWGNINTLYGDETALDLQSEWFAVKGLTAIMPVPGISAVKGATKGVIEAAEKAFDAGKRKIAASIAKNTPDIKLGKLEPGNPASTSLPRNGDRLVLNQGQLPTCGATSCAMITNTAGLDIDLNKLISDAKTVLKGPNQGADMRNLATALNKNGLSATYYRSVTMEELAAATSKGNPAIVGLDLDRGGRAVVVDGITRRMGQPVVAVRDPALGRQYFVPVNEFEAKLKLGAIFTSGVKK